MYCVFNYQEFRDLRLVILYEERTIMSLTERCFLSYVDFTIDESTFEDSSLRLSPPVAPYQPVVVDFPRFQRLVEEHGETGEGVGSGERGGGELSSIAHTGSQQGGGNVTVDSNMDLPKGRGVCV